mmetsp:Transcript_16967/g.22044  ORF Transcript_16967/g.22044 Transcript_16967/m.22044 type:complete len:156 (+) Transcript_16967:93-560(+)
MLLLISHHFSSLMLLSLISQHDSSLMRVNLLLTFINLWSSRLKMLCFFRFPGSALLTGLCFLVIICVTKYTAAEESPWINFVLSLLALVCFGIFGVSSWYERRQQQQQQQQQQQVELLMKMSETTELSREKKKALLERAYRTLTYEDNFESKSLV